MRRLSREVKAVVLLSGGMDSTTTLYLARKYGYKLAALIFDYNQRHKKELKCAVRIAQINRIPYHLVKISLPWTKSALTRQDVKIPFNRNLKRKEVPPTYVSGRNIIFLSYAASFAESIGAKKIFIGAHIQDYSGYPDCREEFLNVMEKAINLGISSRGIEIIYPLINKTKKEIIELGLQLGVPFELTWSCYMGGRKPCGRCDSCRFRISAFESLGIKDPLLARK
ncbi:7-cyano-7-deazaguanine synthase QueC [Candidatus Woesearchaeota archaeon]|nr:MAG: 7-cyano-7-deazaguanine synthase QueC [Candidatus Woesearchaeota archaeon]